MPNLFIQNPDLFNFYNAMQCSLDDEFSLLREVFLGRRDDNRQRLTEKVLSSFTKIVGGVISSIIPNAGIIQQLLNTSTTILYESISQRQAKKEKFHHHLMSKTPDEVAQFVKNVSYEAMITWAPALFWLISRLETFMSKDEALQRINLLGHIAALRAFEVFIKNGLDLDDPTKIIEALVEGSSGGGHQSVFNNALTYNFGSEHIQFTAEGFFSHVAFVFEQQPFVKREATGDVVFVKFDKSLCNQSGALSTLVPKYGFAQLANDGLISKYKFVVQAPTLFLSFGLSGSASPIDFVHKSPFRFVTLKLIKEYLKNQKSLPINRRKMFSLWLSECYPRDFGLKDGSMIAVFRGEIDGSQLEQLQLSDGNFSNTDFSYSTFRKCSLGGFTNARLVGCNFENVTAQGSVLETAILDGSTLTRCHFTNLHITRSLSLQNVTAYSSDFSHLSKSQLANINLEGAEFDVDTIETFDVNSHFSNQLNNEKYNQYQIIQNQYVMMLQKLQEEKGRRSQSDIEAIKQFFGDTEIEFKRRLFKMEEVHHTMHEDISELKRSQAETMRELLLRFEECKAATSDNQNSSGMPQFLDVKTILEEQSYDSAQWLTQPSTLSISTKGTNGANGSNGSSGNNGVSYGQDGVSGQDGEDGQEGCDALGEIDVTMKSIPDERLFFVREDNNHAVPALLALTPNSHMSFDASGGNGGNGGNGGQGGRGADGKPGEDATRRSNGTNGGDGGDGGNGGKPGKGGRGGNARKITLKALDDESYLFALLKGTSVVAGKAGMNGEPGIGAAGGVGGRGGSSYTYSETVSSRSGDHVTYTTYTHTNPGGHPGAHGKGGVNASRLKTTPRDGNSATVQFKLFDTRFIHSKIYTSIYNPVLKNARLYGSDDGIIEPEEIIYAGEITVQNTGDMPTPLQGFSVGAINDELVAFNERDCIYHRQKVLNQQFVILDGRLPMHIKEVIAGSEAPYFQTETIKFGLYIEPIKARMPNFDANSPRELAKTIVQIRYPIELSTGGYTQALIPGYQIPIHFRVRNISTRGFGVDSEQQRLLKLVLDVRCLDGLTSGLQFSTSNDSENRLYSLESSISYDVQYLDKGDELSLTGSVLMPNQSLSSYSRVTVYCKLEIGTLKLPLSKTKAVQISTMELQIAEIYDNAPGTLDILLILNAETSAKTVNSWKTLTQQLGLNLRVFNLSFYGDFDFFDTKFDFNQKLKNAVVIILNNSFRHPLTGKMVTAMQLINKHDVLKAYMTMKTRTYIMGGENVNFEEILTAVPFDTGKQYDSRQHFLTTDDESCKALRDLEVGVTMMATHRTAPYGSSIKASIMEDKTNFLSRQLYNRYPDRMFALGSQYEKQRQPNKWLIFKRYNTGNITLVAGPRIATPGIALSRDISCEYAGYFVLLKLFPFELKMRSLTALMQEEKLFTLMISAILSDLADEYYIFATSTPLSLFNSRGINLETIKSRLVAGAHIRQMDLGQFCQNNKFVKTEFINMLIRFRWLVTQNGARADVSSYYREWLNEKISTLLETDSKQDLRERRRNIQTSLGLNGDTALIHAWENIRDINSVVGKIGVQFDSWQAILNKRINFSFEAPPKERSEVDIELFKLSDDTQRNRGNRDALLQTSSVIAKQSFFHLANQRVVHYLAPNVQSVGEGSCVSEKPKVTMRGVVFGGD